MNLFRCGWRHAKGAAAPNGTIKNRAEGSHNRVPRGQTFFDALHVARRGVRGTVGLGLEVRVDSANLIQSGDLLIDPHQPLRAGGR